MRLFALYLPQFHEIAENNEWWGKGFTEWTHVKGAKPIFSGHQQPIVPLNQNYYDLMNKSTVKWQTSLMKEYGVDGFVYYHYYSCGKKLLERPAENLLQWTEIDQPFFFCWANHTWYQAINGVKKVLREQKYGTKKEWEEHFQYLLPFFKDKRYEKRDNCPVFMIYAGDFVEKKEMVTYFNQRCQEEGFSGIHVIETFSNASAPENYAVFKNGLCNETKNIYIRQPDAAKNEFIRGRKKLFNRVLFKVLRTLSYKGLISWVDKFSGDKFYHIMQKKEYGEPNVCDGIFFSWDNTPRHRSRGYIITPPSKESFMKYMNRVCEDEYVFINAWNEWAEGMILEPTEHNGYKYLEWIKEWNDHNR